MSHHGGQERKYTGEPYWKHLGEVAGLVASSQDPSQHAIAVGWLHDVVEDTSVGLDVIKFLFGEEVASDVQALSHSPEHKGAPRDVRNLRFRSQIAQASYTAKTVKLADIISNVSSIAMHDPRFAKVYVVEKELLMPVLRDSDPWLYKLCLVTLHDCKTQLGL